MQTIFKNCKPRESVFERFDSDDVLDLTNLLKDTIDPQHFFQTNYVTEGMQVLLQTASERFRGESNRGIIKLTQAMGGGKTHSMIALGLLAKHANSRKLVDDINFGSQDIRVIGFSGRESDTKLGIWGELADQLGKKEQFEDYYSPLSSPGQSAWINLLKDQPTLILLDELPPYLANAQAKTIGDSNLAVVTSNALANLFNAINSKELSNVLLVISDLSASWESGSEILQQTFRDLGNELSRFSIDLEPVSSTKDEVFDILKSRLFAELPDQSVIDSIAQEYKKSLETAKKLQLTNDSPERLFSKLQTSYPFHPSVKELYERFKENSGFQQTRGIIRLMRAIIADLWQNHSDEDKYVINAFDIDLNKSDIRNLILQVNQNLTSAISHDIANDGKSISEVLDKEQQTNLHQNTSKLLLMASLANVDGGIVGLTVSELASYLAEPHQKIDDIRKVIENVTTSSWYLHVDKDGKLFFKNIRNLIAEINSLVDSYNYDIARKELRSFLADKFEPQMKDCYQQVMVFPAIDEISLDQDTVKLILFEPHGGGTVHPDLESFWNDTQYKNRVLFLSGERSTMDKLLHTAKQHKAVEQVIARMKEERVSEDSPQFQMAQEKQHKETISLLQAARETFVSLYFPQSVRNENQLSKADFTMEFQNNDFDGEMQIRTTLSQKRKFEEKPDEALLKQKCEDRLFTQRQMRWIDVKQRAATNPAWQWYHPKALDNLKDKLISQDVWREVTGYIDKEPVRDEKTTVNIQQKSRERDTGSVFLRIIPQYGSIVHYEYHNDPTTGSQTIEDLENFKTDQVDVRFLCIDPSGEHETGEVITWKNEIEVRHKKHDQNGQKFVTLQAFPQAEIKYTTDGSDPREHGGTYESPFPIPEGTKYVQAIAHRDGVWSNELRVEVKDEKVEIDKTKALTYRTELRTSDTASTYEELEKLTKYNPVLRSIQIDFTVKGERKSSWLTLQEQGIDMTPKKALELISAVRESLNFVDNVEVTIQVHQGKTFKSGDDFLAWVADEKIDLASVRPDEIEQ